MVERGEICVRMKMQSGISSAITSERDIFAERLLLRPKKILDATHSSIIAFSAREAASTHITDYRCRLV